MDVSEILTRVKAVIDELANLGNQEVTGEENTQNLDSIIKDKIPYALEWVLQNAPQNKIDSSMISSYTGGDSTTEGKLKATIGYNNVVTVELPDSFLRVLSAKLNSWFYSPTPVSEFSDVALMQQGRTTMGSPDKPATVLCTEGGKSVLKMYTAAPGDKEKINTAVSVQLINAPSVSGSATSIDVPTKLEKSFIYYIAYLTLLAFRDASAASFYQVAVSDLGAEDKNQ